MFRRHRSSQKQEQTQKEQSTLPFYGTKRTTTAASRMTSHQPSSRFRDEESTLQDGNATTESFQDEPNGLVGTTSATRRSSGGAYRDDPSAKPTEATASSFDDLSASTSPAPPSSFRLDTLWKNLTQGFTSLQGAPPELYRAYVLKFLDSYSYFSFSIIFTLFLSNDFGLDDVTAGTLYGAWGALITIYGLLTGFVVDNLGVARSLKLGFALSLVARIGIFLTTSRTMLYIHICGTLPLANCLGIPVLTTGIRRYTNESNRGFAFGLFYVIMNVAALISG